MSSHQPDSTSPREEAPAGTGKPRWVKGLLIATLAAALLLAAAMLFLGGEHGPGRHRATTMAVSTASISPTIVPMHNGAPTW